MHCLNLKREKKHFLGKAVDRNWCFSQTYIFLNINFTTLTFELEEELQIIAIMFKGISFYLNWYQLYLLTLLLIRGITMMIGIGVTKDFITLKDLVFLKLFYILPFLRYGIFIRCSYCIDINQVIVYVIFLIWSNFISYY